MIIEYCRNDSFNFGDDLNLWLLPKLLSERVLHSDDGVYLVGIGTLLTKRRFDKTLKNAKRIVIFSSGAWGSDYPRLNHRCKVYGVRGPRTARKLGLPDTDVIGDGAYLLRLLEFNPIAKSSGTAFIPHHRSEDYVDWKDICEAAGLKFISAKQPVDTFISEIRSCQKVISEAMHGAIAADAFRIPWVTAKFSPSFNEEKWLDWSESMSMQLNFHSLPTVYQTPPPFFRALENRIKRKMPASLPQYNKWQTLPVAFKKSKPADIKKLSEALRQLDLTETGHMSRNEDVERITGKLEKQLSKLADDYINNEI